MPLSPGKLPEYIIARGQRRLGLLRRDLEWWPLVMLTMNGQLRIESIKLVAMKFSIQFLF